MAHRSGTTSRGARRPSRAAAAGPAAAGFRRAPAALAVAAALGLPPWTVQAQPAGPQVIHGQASFTRSGSNLLVTTRNGAGTSHSAISWQSFSVPGGSTTHFRQPTAASTSINRVLGHDPSSIFGTLSSNGRLVLVNPAGIAVGAGAVVDTAGFTASTLAMSEADALAARMRFAGGGGAMQVDGKVVARHGDVVLIAPQLQTGGQAVVRSAGATVLAAGRSVELTGRGLEGIHLEVQAPADAAVNLGSLEGDAVGVFAGTLRHSGLVQANAVTTEGGKVVLRALGDNLVSGRVTAVAGGSRGGAIDVLGERVGLLAGAVVQASGANGGGTIRIGGDYRGGNTAVPNAKQTVVHAGAAIRADATREGDGGRVIVWADETTRMDGRISARGGPEGGDGGFAEVSGKKTLEYTGRTDLRAPKGRSGTLLLDPDELRIVDADAGPNEITDESLESQLAESDVQLSASVSEGGGGGGLITLDAGVDVGWTSGNTLSLWASHGIGLNGALDGPGGQLHLFVQHGNIVQPTGGSIVVDALYAEARQQSASSGAGGMVRLQGDNAVRTLAGYASGDLSEFSFRNIGTSTLKLGTVSTGFGGGAGIYVGTAAGSAHGLADIRTAGTFKMKGDGDLQAGSIFLEAGGDVDLRSGYVTAAVGDMDISAEADVRIGSAPSATTASLQGAGAIRLDAGADVVIGRPDADLADSRYTYLNADGLLQIQAARNVRASKAGSGHYSQVALYGAGGAAGGVRIFARGAESDGMVDLGPYTYVHTYQSPIEVEAANAILGNASFHTHGSLTGWISLTATRGGIAAGNLNSQGSFSGIPGSSVTLMARGDIALSNNIHANGYDAYSGSLAGAGGQVQVTSQEGGIFLNGVYAQGGHGNSFAPGAPGGNVTLTAPNGPVDLDELYTNGGDSELGSGGNAGTILIRAGGDVDLHWVSASGGHGGGAAGAGGRGGLLDVASGMGGFALGAHADLRGGNGSSSGSGGSGGNGGTLLVRAQGDLWMGSVSASGGWGGGSAGAGGRGGAVDAATTAGGLWLMGHADVQGGGGSGTGVGGAGGEILLQATGPAGPLPSFGPAPGSVAADRLLADGGSGQSGNGGIGGSATVRATGDIILQSAQAQGGSASAGAATGGRGGTLRFFATEGSLTTDADLGLYADGGTGRAAGGRGGTIELEVGGDVDTPLLSAVGGEALRSRGTGGRGGSISVRMGGALTSSQVLAFGQHGADGDAARPQGGTGGRGGSILVEKTGPGTLAFDSVDLVAGGGRGGNGFHDPGSGSCGCGGTGGGGGSISLLAQESVNISHVYLDADAGSGGTHGDGSGGGAYGSLLGSVVVRGGQDVILEDASLELGAASFTAEAGGDLSLRTALTTRGGAVSLTAGPRLDVLAPIDTTDGGQVPGGTLQLAASGTVLIAAAPAEGDGDFSADALTVMSVLPSAIGLSAGATTISGAVVSVDATNTVTADGELRFSANEMHLDGHADSGANHTIFETFTAARAITLGGSDETAALNLTQAEIDRVSAGVLAIGSSAGSGGLHLAGPLIVGTDLSLVSGGAITQASGATLQAGRLHVDGSSVDLGDVAIGELSGGAGVGGFRLANGSGDLTVGSVAGVAGIGAQGVVQITTEGRLTLHNTISSDASGDAVVLAPSSLQVESGAGIGTPAGRWLIYLDSPDGNVFNGLVSGQHALWNRTFAGSPPGSVSETGNRYLFAHRPTVEVRADAASKVYDGTAEFPGLGFAHDGLVDAAGHGDVFLQDVFTGALSTTATRHVGSYRVTQGSLAVSGYALAFTDNTATITPAPLSVQASTDSKVYDATTASAAAPTVTLGTLFGSDRGLFTQAFATRHAGSGKTLVPGGSVDDGNGGRNYVLTFVDRHDGSITPRPITVTAVADSKVYDATTRSGMLPTITTGTLAAGDTSALSQRFADKNAGTGKSLLSSAAIDDGNGGANYTVTLVNSSDGVITPRVLTVTGAVAGDKVYDASTAAAVGGSVVLQTAFEGDDLFVRGATGQFGDKNVGSDKPVAVSITLGGADAGNYQVQAPEGVVADITPASLLLGGLAAQDKVYDGTVLAALTGTATLGGVFAGDQVSVGGGSASFADRNAGAGKQVSLGGMALSGADAGNYLLILPADLRADITPAPLTIAANNMQKLQGEALVFQGTEFSASGLVAGEHVTLVSLQSAGAPASAPSGAYPIVPGGAQGEAGFLASNYAITYLNGALAVLPANASGHPAVQQVNNQVVTFARLFLQEALARQDAEIEERQFQEGDIVTCTP